MTNPSHKDSNHESGKTQASLPRFRGTVIPPLDSLIIKVLPPILIILVVVAVTMNPNGVSDMIQFLRTKITSGWAWFIILYSLVSVAMCVWLTFSK